MKRVTFSVNGTVSASSITYPVVKAEVKSPHGFEVTSAKEKAWVDFSGNELYAHKESFVPSYRKNQK